MHYGVPRMLAGAGLLERLDTDICAAKGWPALLRAVPARWRPAGLRKLLGRVPVGVPARKIRAFTSFGWAYRRRLAACRPAEQTAVYLWAGRRFCELVLRHGLGRAAGVYTFNIAGLEVLRQARRLGLRAVTEQTIAPRAVEQALLEEERGRFPGWEGEAPGGDGLAEYCARERAEWSEADLVVCGSEFVRQTVAGCAAGAAGRCVVVPYGTDQRFTVAGRGPHGGPLRVLTVGAVGLRKGSPYVLEAARRMKGRAHFRMVGAVAASDTAARDLRAHVEVVGAVPRSEILAHYAWADVFLLPSLCEGSATVTYEAMACGLPVVCTPNTGSTVRDGVEGFLVPVRDPDAVAGRLDWLAGSAGLLSRMAKAARERAGEFTLAKYSERLRAALEGDKGRGDLGDG
jgi:glycosyltransferase involved in cell wall biosynthesis